jgi:hypothetical protein
MRFRNGMSDLLLLYPVSYEQFLIKLYGPSLAGFYIISILAGGFSAIFAYVLSLLGGKQGIAGWAWIFVSTWQASGSADLRRSYLTCQIIEGAITIIFGIISWFYIPAFPDQNTFLTQEQTAFVLERVENDRGDSIPDVLTTKKVIQHLLDWKVWAFGEEVSFRGDSRWADESVTISPHVHVCDDAGVRNWVGALLTTRGT